MVLAQSTNIVSKLKVLTLINLNIEMITGSDKAYTFLMITKNPYGEQKQHLPKIIIVAVLFLNHLSRQQMTLY